MTSLVDQLLPFHVGDGSVPQQPKTFAENTQPAECASGVLYQGPWQTVGDGFQEHVRRSARALTLSGLPVKLRAIQPVHEPPQKEEVAMLGQFRDLTDRSMASYTAQVQQVVPVAGLLPRLVSHRHIPDDLLLEINRRRVLYTVWERQHGLMHEDVVALNLAGQCWVGCGVSRQFLIDAGVQADKVRVVPCPYLPDDPVQKFRGRKRVPGVPRFYHIGKWEPRKNQDQLLLSFLIAFKPGEAMLFVKTSERWPDTHGYPSGPMTCLVAYLHDSRVAANGWTKDNALKWIFIISSRLSAEKLRQLHHTGDVYVTVSRGEGFDMPALDAKLAGNLLVYTPAGAPVDFHGEDDVEVPATGTIPCHPFYNWPADATYLSTSTENVVAGLRRAFELVKNGRDGSRCDLASYEAGAVGQRMRAYLEELVPELSSGS